jgi:hypothetical protein
VSSKGYAPKGTPKSPTWWQQHKQIRAAKRKRELLRIDALYFNKILVEIC